jgi:type VI secretion system protein ImpJ
MINERPIFWHEGLFLRPQHFQQQDLYLATQIRNAALDMNPYYWGVSRLQIQKSKLNNHVLDLDVAELIFPDGTRVVLPGNGQLSSRSFEDKWGDSGESLPVYLGLRNLSSSDNNIDQTFDSNKNTGASIFQTRRYSAVGTNEIVNDLFQKDAKEEVSYLNYQLQIFFGNEIGDAVDFQLIKICELKRFGSEVKVVDDFIPPCTRVDANEQLAKIIRDLKEQLTSRAHELSLYKDERSLETGQIGGREFTYLLAFRSLSRQVPLLFHLTEKGTASPYQVYGLLRQIVGELSTFSQRFNLFGLEEGQEVKEAEYQHDELGKCFAATARKITLLLDELTAGPDYTSELFYDGTYFTSDLDDKAIRDQNEIYLCVKSQLPEEFVVSSINDLAKVASRELLPLLIARSLPGLDLDFQDSPPTALPRRVGSYYFKLSNKGDAWGAVKEGRNIALYLDNPPADLAVEIMVIYG